MLIIFFNYLTRWRRVIYMIASRFTFTGKCFTIEFKNKFFVFGCFSLIIITIKYNYETSILLKTGFNSTKRVFFIIYILKMCLKLLWKLPESRPRNKGTFLTPNLWRNSIRIYLKSFCSIQNLIFRNRIFTFSITPAYIPGFDLLRDKMGISH